MSERKGFHPQATNAEAPYFAEHLLSPELPRFSTAIAVAFIDSSSTKDGRIIPSTRILAGVRDPEKSPTDPDVISLPTRRVTPAFATDLLRHYVPATINETGSAAAGKKVEVSWKQKHAHDKGKLRDEVLALLVQKLGVNEALGKASLGKITLETSILGKVYGTNDDPEHGEDMLHMLGIRADVITDNTNLFPPQTDHYYSLQFIAASDFTHLVDTKDPFLIAQFGDFSKVCVRGLCVRAGNKMIKDSQ